MSDAPSNDFNHLQPTRLIGFLLSGMALISLAFLFIAAICYLIFRL